MTAFIRAIFLTLLVFGLSTCGHSKFLSYNGPTVTSVEVHKADRVMYLLHDGAVLKQYKIGLGGNPIGHKHFEGDGKTPEGAYFISQRNPDSNYHLSLRISYPNDADRAFAKAAGEEPGGDIFIHGRPDRTWVRGDWTVGCIAVKDREMEQIYAMVNPGTQINIYP